MQPDAPEPPAHDAFTRLLRRLEPDPEALWAEARPMVHRAGGVLILDDFGLREHTAAQADDLYELISDRAVSHRPLILTSNRQPLDWYPLFPNPVVAESLLDRLINTSHQVLMDGPSYRPRKRPGRADSTPTPTAG